MFERIDKAGILTLQVRAELHGTAQVYKDAIWLLLKIRAKKQSAKTLVT